MLKHQRFGKAPSALSVGRDYAAQNLSCPLGIRVKRANNVGNKIFVDGNSAAALGAVYGGASICAWYPITPSSSLAEAFIKHCQKLRVDPYTRNEVLRKELREVAQYDAGVARSLQPRITESMAAPWAGEMPRSEQKATRCACGSQVRALAAS